MSQYLWNITVDNQLYSIYPNTYDLKVMYNPSLTNRGNSFLYWMFTETSPNSATYTIGSYVLSTTALNINVPSDFDPDADDDTVIYEVTNEASGVNWVEEASGSNLRYYYQPAGQPTRNPTRYYLTYDSSHNAIVAKTAIPGYIFTKTAAAPPN